MNLMMLKTGTKKAGTTDLYGILRIHNQYVKLSNEGGRTKEQVLWRIHSGEGAIIVYVKEDYVLGLMEVSYPKSQEPFAFIDDVKVDVRYQGKGIEQLLYENAERLLSNRKLLSKTYQKEHVM